MAKTAPAQTAPASQARLQAQFREKIAPALIEKFGYTTPMQVPRITKITLNMGVSEAVADKKVMDNAVGDLTKIAGQHGTLCPDIYDPVTAIASGDYQGARVIFRQTYPNRCDLARHTAPLFEL